MRVLLLGEMSGTRNGQQWPPRGSEVDLPDDEGALLCSQGMARPVASRTVETAVVSSDEEIRLTTENGPGRRRRRDA